MCTSWPQAWHTPGTGRPVRAPPSRRRSGRASMSARSRTVGPSAAAEVDLQPGVGRPAAGVSMPGHVEPGPDRGGRLVLLPGQLGVGVQVTPEGDQLARPWASRKRSRPSSLDGAGSPGVGPGSSTSEVDDGAQVAARASTQPALALRSWGPRRRMREDALQLVGTAQLHADRAQGGDQLGDGLGAGVGSRPRVVDDQVGVEAVAGGPPLVLAQDPVRRGLAAPRPPSSAGRARSPGTGRARRGRPPPGRVGMPSHIRSSTVPKSGCGRMSHHTSRIVVMRAGGDQRLHERARTRPSRSSGSGRPAVGRPSKTLLRLDARPVS